MASTEHTWHWPDGEQGAEINQLWQEYQYRHEHVWTTVFQTTIAMVAMSVVPYLSESSTVGLIKSLPPIFAGILGVFAWSRLNREFLLLNTVKQGYLDKTRHPTPYVSEGRFEDHTKLYILAMTIAAFFNSIYLFWPTASNLLVFFLR